MNPLHSVSTIADRNSATSSTLSLKEFLEMAPAPPSSAAIRSRSAKFVREFSPHSFFDHTYSHHTNGFASINHNNNYSGNNNIGAGADSGDHGGRLIQRTPPSMMDLSSRLSVSMHEPRRLSGDHREVKINDIVGYGISGILYKWVNYGKGWRPRWFVLQDGVLSYYKIHGRHKIEVNQETEKRSKVIGEESLRRVWSRKNSHSQFHRKPFGEVHLKVSSIRESKSDDKRFSIYTGTKRLHLRAETREDRVMWMDAFQAVKGMFPRLSNCEVMDPVDNVVSTEKLRQRLLEEGVDEAAIQDSEQIMRNEFSALQNQFVLLKQKQFLLLDTLRQLEVYISIRKNHHPNGIWSPPSVSSAQIFVRPDAFQMNPIMSS